MIRKTTPERLSFFSDAIFAVLITVLVLGLHPPERPTFEAFLELWPTWLSYAVSYLFIAIVWAIAPGKRSEEHTSELQSRSDLVCRLLLEKKKHCVDGNGRPRGGALQGRRPEAPRSAGAGAVEDAGGRRRRRTRRRRAHQLRR